MNQHEIDDLVRSADPYDPGSIRDLDDSLGELLEEVVDQPRIDRPALARRAALRRDRRRRHSLRMRLVIAAGSAAALTVAAGVPVLLAHHGDDPGQAASPDRSGHAHDSSISVPIRYTAAAVRVARHNPRVLVHADGWKVHDVEGFRPDAGDMTFQYGPDKWRNTKVGAGPSSAPAPGAGPKGEATKAPEPLTGFAHMNDAPQLDVTWYPASEYDALLADRDDEPSAHQGTALGGRALLVDYGKSDHAALLPPSDGVFLELRGSNIGDEEAFLAFLDDHVDTVDVATWLAAMPPEVVTAKGADAAAQKILADLPIPPGFDRSGLDHGQALDSYQFGATVAGAVACGWFRDWEHARSTGDDAEARKAADALASSHHWKVLQTMQSEGDYPKELWRYADQVVAGHAPHGYASALGCS